MSNFDIVVANEEDKEKWNEYVHKSENGTFFHLFDWLLISEQKVGFNLLPLFIKRGQKIVGIAPLFYKSVFGLKIVMSPPPRMSTPWAGPIFEFQSDKPNKVEKYTNRLFKSIHSYLVEELKADYVNLTTTDNVSDLRPLKWLGYESSPNYTYSLDIISSEDVFNEFDSRIRRYIRKADSIDEIQYISHDNSYLYDVLNSVHTRYKEQGKVFSLDENIFHKILNTDLKNYLTTVAIKDKEGLVTGMILIDYKDQIHHWIGAVKPEREYPGVNEYLHWNVIKEFSGKGYKKYELMGGNTEHLCSHKSKYSGGLEMYFNSQWSNYKGKLIQAVQKVIS